ncbi:MAG: VWA domain-containing protein [Chloroflexi bacterium]|nr:VWA domain-containing protein [Chloroflexota bacterium]
MTFSSPLFLLLFLLTPLILWLGWPSRAVSRRREIASLAVRLILFAALVLSLAGLELVRTADNLAVVFLVDVSDSMPEGAKAGAVAWVQRAITQMGPDDKGAVILFGGDALVEHPMTSTRTISEFTSIPVTNATDLSQAIRLALALFPAQAAKRIVIISDGIATTGNAEEAARLAAAAGAQITAVPVVRGEAQTSESLVTDVSAPSSLRQGEEFTLNIRVKSSVAQRVGVRVFAGAEVVYEGTLELIAGEQSYPVTLKAGTPGFIAYKVQIVPANGQDTFYQNNELAAFSQVKGPPRVLLVTGQNDEAIDEGRELAAALQAAGIDFDRVPPSGLPSELPLLAEYASVVIVNTPARDLTQRQQIAIEQYVRDLGGGLLVVGGPNSYGVGGYFRTPLEDVLPVEMQLKDQKRRPRLTIVFVIDHSGSMSESSGGAEKIELAKEAAIRAVELLAPTDNVGVVQFDDSASWVAPITPLDDPDSVINRIASIRSAGGTDILSGVQAVASELPDDDSQIKHVILLTDGQADPTGIASLVEQMYNDNGITMSTVAVGRDADQQLLELLAQVGGGRYHFAENPTSIPEIFTEETTLATRAYIIEESFFPEQIAPSPIMQGIEAVPQLHGYVGTTAKSAAQTILVSQLADGAADPILASWQYGLGRAVAWTSDATGRWASDWVQWDGFATLFAQAIRFTINESVQSDITADVKLDGETATLAVDAFDNSGDFINSLALTANVVGPDGATQTVEMTQVAPGRYEAEFTPTEQGAYLIRVAGAGDGANISVGETAGWVLTYSPEYKLPDDPEAGVDSLAQLTLITGMCAPNEQNVLNLADCFADDPKEAFAHNQLARNVTSPVWPYLLLLATLLLPFDIAIRRLVISRYDLRRAAARIQTFVVGLRRPALEPERAESLSRLRQAKQRAGSTLDSPLPSVPQSETMAKLPTTQPPNHPASHPPTESTPLPPKPEGETTASALLAKKKTRK